MGHHLSESGWIRWITGLHGYSVAVVSMVYTGIRKEERKTKRWNEGGSLRGSNVAIKVIEAEEQGFRETGPLLISRSRRF